jgi:hypothetical protein
MDASTRRAADRLERAAERVQIAMALLAGLLVAFAAGITFLVILTRHVVQGLDSEVPD